MFNETIIYIEKKKIMWLFMAVLSAFFAGLTSILAKCGIKKTDSDIATAIRTIIVLLSAWCMVFVVQAMKTITQIDLKSFSIVWFGYRSILDMLF